MSNSVILGGYRTPFTKFNGSLQGYKAVDLGGIAINAVLNKLGLSASEIDELVLGMVLQSAAGQVPSRQAAHKAGLPWSVRTETINKVCASGMRAVTLADQIIRASDAELIVAGGMESMTHAPYLLKSARFGQKMGHSNMLDAILSDGLMCSFHNVHMIEHAGKTASDYGITREMQDQWALRSHMRACRAQQSGKFNEEIVPITVASRKNTFVVNSDETVRCDTSFDKLSSLKAVYPSEGTITAGNAPGVNDGAAAIVVSSLKKAHYLGIQPLAKIIDQTTVGVEPENFAIAPAVAVKELLLKNNLTIQDIDLFEINEAFAAVALVNAQLLQCPEEKLNVNGGAVAMGHPIGASGARIILTLALELKRCGGGLGIAAICSGAGQGDAILIQVDA